MQTTLAITMLAVGLVGCGNTDNLTVVFVTVQARPGVRNVATLRVTATNDSASVDQDFDIVGDQFPLTFTVTPTSRAGALEVTATAHDSAGLVLAEGSAIATIADGKQVDLDLMLDPYDFVVNEAIAGAQRPSYKFDGLGRQLAAGPNGGLFASYVNDCSMLGRCDVFVRLFDYHGVPAVNQTSMTTGEFIANLTEEYIDGPAVAVGSQGALVVWETATALRGVAMTADGGHKNSVETAISTADVLITDPGVAALPSGEFIVVWTQERLDGGTDVRGRLLDSMGMPVTNPTTGDNLDFLISANTTLHDEFPHVAAMGDGRAFAVTWRQTSGLDEPSNIWARFYGSTGAAAASAAAITNRPNSYVGAAHVAHIAEDEAAFVFSITDANDPRLAGRAVLLVRAAGPSVAVRGADLVVATGLDSPEFVVEPVVATQPDGTMLVAWHNCTAEDGDGCAVSGQLVRSNGAPLGRAFPVNTTTADNQWDPSVVALPGSFALIWADSSQAPPDTDLDAVRGRILYPNFDPRDGQRGARCGGARDEPCTTGLICMSGTGAPLCHEQCDSAAAVPCSGGGVCTTTAGQSACVF